MTASISSCSSPLYLQLCQTEWAVGQKVPARAPEVTAPSEDTPTRNTATLSFPHLRLPKLADYLDPLTTHPHPHPAALCGRTAGKVDTVFPGKTEQFQH